MPGVMPIRSPAEIYEQRNCFMRRSRLFASSIALLAVGSLFGTPARASAQSFAFGPNFSVVRGDVTTSAPATQLFGGTVRINASPRIALEGGIDFASRLSTDGTQQIRERPIEAALLIFPFRTTIAPYFLGGIVFNTDYTDTLDATGATTQTTSTRTTGWQAGIGAELVFHKRFGLYADYRWRDISTSDQTTPSGGTVTATPVIPGVSILKFSHQGSMWTGGMLIHF